MKNGSKLNNEFEKVFRMVVVTAIIVAVFSLLLGYLIINPNFFDNEMANPEDSVEIILQNDGEDYEKIENGIHVATGFVDAPGMKETIQNCTNCHSSKLVIQNRMTKERWKTTIKWMQETQNLWDLGKNEDIIIDYLVTNYPPREKGRRENLTNIEWYQLKE